MNRFHIFTSSRLPWNWSQYSHYNCLKSLTHLCSFQTTSHLLQARSDPDPFDSVFVFITSPFTPNKQTTGKAGKQQQRSVITLCRCSSHGPCRLFLHWRLTACTSLCRWYSEPDLSGLMRFFCKCGLAFFLPQQETRNVSCSHHPTLNVFAVDVVKMNLKNKYDNHTEWKKIFTLRRIPPQGVQQCG